MPGKCKFQESWLMVDQWKMWLRLKDDYTASCQLCKKSFDVSHSGISAIKSHEKGIKHVQFVKSFSNQTAITFNRPRPISSSIQVRPIGNDKEP